MELHPFTDLFARQGHLDLHTGGDTWQTGGELEIILLKSPGASCAFKNQKIVTVDRH